LGEKGKWSKAGSLWEEGARIPFFIAAPRAKGNGTEVHAPRRGSEFLPDAGRVVRLPVADGRRDAAWMPLLDNPKAEWNHPAHTVWSEDGRTLTGIGVRVERLALCRVCFGRGRCWLDMENDPHQLKNLAHDPRYAEVTKQMAGWCRSTKNEQRQPRRGIFPAANP